MKPDLFQTNCVHMNCAKEIPRPLTFKEKLENYYPIIIPLGAFLLTFIIYYLIYHYKRDNHAFRKAILHTLLFLWIFLLVWFIVFCGLAYYSDRYMH